MQFVSIQWPNVVELHVKPHATYPHISIPSSKHCTHLSLLFSCMPFCSIHFHYFFLLCNTSPCIYKASYDTDRLLYYENQLIWGLRSRPISNFILSTFYIDIKLERMHTVGEVSSEKAQKRFWAIDRFWEGFFSLFRWVSWGYPSLLNISI